MAENKIGASYWRGEVAGPILSAGDGTVYGNVNRPRPVTTVAISGDSDGMIKPM